MPTNLADAPPGEIGDPGPDIADLELDRIATWSCYQEVRRTTEALCAPLEIEDYVIQSMPDASPAKWHLAHTSWFFETFVLASVQPGFEPVDSEYSYLFNSYYNAVGERIARDRRGVLSRPTVAEVFRYRAAVDKRMKEFLDRASNSLPRITREPEAPQERNSLRVSRARYLQAIRRRTRRLRVQSGFAGQSGGLCAAGG